MKNKLTAIEVMVAIAIFGLLIAIIVPVVNKYYSKNDPRKNDPVNSLIEKIEYKSNYKK